jgi:hypothetical protein
VAHPDLAGAIDHLDLWELPWMKRGLESFRHGYTWQERYLARDFLDPIDDFEPPAHRAKGGRRRGHLRLV